MGEFCHHTPCHGGGRVSQFVYGEQHLEFRILLLKDTAQISLSIISRTGQRAQN